MSILLMIGLLFALMIVGVPVAAALALASLAFVATNGMPPMIVLANMVNGINSFPLIAVPFFILAGNLMNTTGITARLLEFSRLLTGWIADILDDIDNTATIDRVRGDVLALCKRFPVYGGS